MNNIWGAIVLAIVFVLLGNYLSQFWPPLVWIGFIAGLAVVGYYLFSRNQRIQ